LWWGRLGKIVEFLAALAVVADIIGPERLRRYGKSLHGAMNLHSIRSNIVLAFNLIKDSILYILGNPKRQNKTALDRVLESPFANLDIGTAAILTVIALYLLISENLSFSSPLPWWAWLLMTPAIFLAVYGVVSPFVTSLVIILSMLLGLIIDTIFIEPLAWIMERESIDRLIKIVSIALLLIGFHFDLLAS
jgi:uncharacterized membrane protein YdcZ (DUF606 family)